MRWTYLRLRLKDYDALVGLTFGTSDLQCASEYERSTKSTARYVDIRRQLAQKTMVHAVIYIVERGRANSLDRRPVKLAQFQSSLCYLQRIFFALGQTRMRCTRLLQEVHCGVSDTNGSHADPRSHGFAGKLTAQASIALRISLRLAMRFRLRLSAGIEVKNSSATGLEWAA